MKVGTDGVLLGAWTGMEHSCALSGREREDYKLLDVGTGSGLIALMLAQRFPKAIIDAIDIDSDAVSQADENFVQSPWSERLHCRHISVQALAEEKEGVFDAVVSNPPYFIDSLKNPDHQRQAARHTDTLSYEDLLRSARRLLQPEGDLFLILPAESEKMILFLASENGFSPTRLVYIYSKPGKPAKRILLALTKRKGLPCEQSQFFIESESSPRSDEYTALTKEFYL